MKYDLKKMGKNGRRPQTKWKTTSKKNGRRPQKKKKGRRPQKNGTRLQVQLKKSTLIGCDIIVN